MVNLYGLIQRFPRPATETIHQVTGTATYSGAAAGIYVLKTGDTNDPDYHNGEFTASANLTAHFGQSATSASVAPKDLFTIRGSISNFSPTEGSHDLSGWELELKSADLLKAAGRGADDTPITTGGSAIAADSFIGLATDTTVADRTFKGATNGGEWQGSFYGNASAVAAATDDYPEAVVGEFNGQFSNGNAVGVFGAEKD